MTLELATCSYRDFDPAMGVPVQISIGRPKFPLRYDLTEQVRSLMPWGLLGADDFVCRYRERLEQIEPGVLTGTFASISERHGGARLVALCFEDVHAGQFCHRRVFAAWWHERTGQPVPEVEPPEATYPAKGQNSKGGSARPTQLRLLGEDATRKEPR
jgi:hypothetical protein